MPKLSEKQSAKPSENPTQASAPLCPEFSLEQRRTLLGIAHQAILYGLEHRPFSVVAPASPALSEKRGAFTTLYLGSGVQGGVRRELHRELRGCVGYAAPLAPLYRAVAETARAAAFEDSRFLPVTKEEVPRLEVFLSVLSHLFPIHPDALVVGRHGLVVSEGSRRGLLLPQVPVENAWDRETFLEQTCRKAGLPADAWQRGASIEAFTTEVFSDSDVAMPC